MSRGAKCTPQEQPDETCSRLGTIAHGPYPIADTQSLDAADNCATVFSAAEGAVKYGDTPSTIGISQRLSGGGAQLGYIGSVQ